MANVEMPTLEEFRQWAKAQLAAAARARVQRPSDTEEEDYDLVQLEDGIVESAPSVRDKGLGQPTYGGTVEPETAAAAPGGSSHAERKERIDSEIAAWELISDPVEHANARMEYERMGGRRWTEVKRSQARYPDDSEFDPKPGWADLRR